MDSTSKFPHEILLDLLSLRNKMEMDSFMNKLYDALTVEFRNVLDPDNMKHEHRLALFLMIEHFLKKEEYEKCAALQKIIFKEPCNKRC